MVPPLIKCAGIQTPSAKAANGIYEYQGTVGGRPCYHQTGISSGNHIWFVEEAYQGPMWVITPKSEGIRGCPTQVIATCSSLARWPWETVNWFVCGPMGSELVSSPGMCISILNPVAELEIQHTILPSGGGNAVEVGRFRCLGDVHGRPAYRRIDRDDGVEQRLFWLESQRGPALPRMGRWLLVNLKEDGSGIDTLVARSHPDDGASWASLWPWHVEKNGWERTTCDTYGLEPGDAEFVLDRAMNVRMTSPNITFSGLEDAPFDVGGIYIAKGMTNGRVYYLKNPSDALNDTTGALIVWFAEERGQWVITGADKLGDSTQVVARIASRAWWPWEAHLTSNSSPGLMGAAMLAAMPVWHEGAAMLSQLRTAWEMSDPAGQFRKMKDMGAELVHEKQLSITAGEGALHPFLGEYVCAGLLSCRPYYVQRRKEVKKKLRYALWYAEDAQDWVITNDYRLLDGTTVDARVDDSAWLPWEVASCWDVADGQGGFAQDILLQIAVSTAQLTRKGPKKKTRVGMATPSEPSPSVTSASDAGKDGYGAMLEQG